MTRRPEPPLTITLDEHLDAEAVARALALLAAAPPQGPVLLDFGPVRHVEWFALAGLARELAREPPGRVSLRGVCDSHLRVLRYLDAGLVRRWGREAAHDGDAASLELVPAAGHAPHSVA